MDRSRWWHLLLLTLACAFLFFYGLERGELYRNETLRAIIGREMLRTGNWILPTLYGQPLFTKPPGMYVAIALCSWPFGEVSEWTARLPSALAATLVVFLIYWFVSGQIDRRAGLLAALFLPMSIFWLERSISAEIDMLDAAWVSAAIVFFLKGACAQNVKHTSVWLFVALVCVSGGTLTRWTAPFFFYGMAIPFLIWRRNLKLLWSWQHLLGVTIAAILVSGWIAAAVAQTSWLAFYTTIKHEALHHLAEGHVARGSAVWATLIFPAKVFAAMLPWSLLSLITLRPRFMRLWDERGRCLLQALHCWAWPSLLFWSLTSDHAARHCAPLFPAFSMLAALVCLAWSRGLLGWKLPRVRPRQVLAVAFGLWLIVKIVFVEVIVPQRTAQRHARQTASLLASLLPTGTILYLFKLKDEGIMFYYGREAMRLLGALDLPAAASPVFCILTEDEWRTWSGSRSAHVVQEMRDSQGDSIVLVSLYE